MANKSAPKILMFDSGVGGLSILQKVYKINNNALFYYLFDHQCFPYGDKSEAFLKQRVDFLLKSISKKIHPDLIVIACNTASTTVLPNLRSIFSIPIVGVVPAIKPAAKISKKHHICLLATQGTITRAYTDYLINEFASDCKVLRIGSQDLVCLAEEELIRKKEPSLVDQENYQIAKIERIKKILEPILQLQESEKPDIVVLGCTHFPFVKEDIAKVLGPSISLIDSSDAIARRVKFLLESNELQGDNSNEGGLVEAFYTGMCNDDEKLRFAATFKNIGFNKVSSFEC